MDSLFKIVICFMCLQFVITKETYRAAIVDISKEDVTVDNYLPLISEASNMGADILVLPFLKYSTNRDSKNTCCKDHSEVIKSISDAVKKSPVYVVAHIMEKIQCQDTKELTRNNIVFDREGSVISVYRKRLYYNDGPDRCNITNTHSETFTTDFGVTFGLLMEEDLVLKHVDDLNGVKNFVVPGTKSHTDLPFLTENQFPSSWAYATNANLVASTGIYAGKAGLFSGSGRILIAELNTDGSDEKSTVKFSGPRSLSHFHEGHLSQYTIKPVDLVASSYGYRDTVCHNDFCCDFYLKTRILGDTKGVNYGLIAFDGVQHYDLQHVIGVQSCGVVACVELGDSCLSSLEQSNNIVFDEVKISGNFIKNSVLFPNLLFTTDTDFESNKIVITEESKADQKRVTAKLYDAQNLHRFGIFSRDYSKDFVSKINFNHHDEPFVEGVQEFFDYLWIRLRVVILVVSIYILEMM